MDDQTLQDGTTVEWNGYTIKKKVGYVDKTPGVMVVKDGCNPMPGGCWFHTVDDAKKGIAALILSEQTGGDFWCFMELTR